MARIVTETDEEVNRKLVEETAKATAKQVTEEFKKTMLEEQPSGGSGSKVSQILKKATEANSSKSEEERLKEEEEKKNKRIEHDKEMEKLLKEKEDSEVFCPTCSKGHEHKHVLKKTEKGTLKCNDGNCSTEFALVPTKPDYKCHDCGTPHKKPAEPDENDKCPLCGGKEFDELQKFEINRYLGLDKGKKKGLI